MSKLQKWCPNYIQVCTLAEPGGCLTGATGYSKKKCFSIALRHTLVVLEMH